MILDENDYIAHYGILRRSGRYPWGSGGNVEDVSKRNKVFLDYVHDLRAQGLSDVEICRGLDMLTTDNKGRITTTELRAAVSYARAEQRQSQIAQIESLADKGYSNVKIGERLGLPESTVRSLREPGAKDRANRLETTANMLKDQVAQKQYIDVGKNVSTQLGISDTQLKTAVGMLREEGYNLYYLKVPQLGTGLETTVKVLVPPNVSYSELSKNRDKVQQIINFSDDGGNTFSSGKVHPPIPVHPDRVAVKYAEDGGGEADGVIYVRPGVKDLSMGSATYSQVRIQVGDNHYLKGMAMYKNDLPDGVDLLFNTNKSNTGNKLDAMKELSSDPDLPFKSVVRQILENPGTPHERNISALNIVNEEGNWDKWSRTLSSQMLSKQEPKLAKQQLDMTFEQRKLEFDRLSKLTNPVVKRRLLEEFADGTDSAAVHLKAAALPRQANKVILPISSMKPTEVYAPSFIHGERVVLIRFPHGGTFEIPELTVNNRNREAVKLLGDARDAIGIHHSVAERLSGADFDGDTVLVIPNNLGKVKHTSALEGLKDFNPKVEYAGFPGMKKMTNTQTEMGKISNLITDMTIKGAPHSELVRAVRHSMVVIDAEKHGLNYKLSYERNGIKQLQQKYQSRPDGKSGASTIISRKKSPVEIPERKPRPAAEGGPIDKETGARVYVPTGRTNYKTGKPVTIRRPALEVTDNAHTLSSGQPIERLYADHSNRLKALANTARLEAIRTPTLKYSPSAKKTYAQEVRSLESKLAIAQKNAPLERQAQIIANTIVKAKRDATPDLDKDTLKKIKTSALNVARLRTGANKKQRRIEITPKEWEAIQAGAISPSKLSSILDNTDMDLVKQYAMPKQVLLMTPTKTARAKSMLADGYTRAEVAQHLGVSLSTLDNAVE